MDRMMTTTKSCMIKPAWTPATIGLMVLGFVVFWPLGLAMLAYILWGDRFEECSAMRKINGGEPAEGSI